jgi:hypothetical protein
VQPEPERLVTKSKREKSPPPLQPPIAEVDRHVDAVVLGAAAAAVSPTRGSPRRNLSAELRSAEPAQRGENDWQRSETERKLAALREENARLNADLEEARRDLATRPPLPASPEAGGPVASASASPKEKAMVAAADIAKDALRALQALEESSATWSERIIATDDSSPAAAATDFDLAAAAPTTNRPPPPLPAAAAAAAAAVAAAAAAAAAALPVQQEAIPSPERALAALAGQVDGQRVQQPDASTSTGTGSRRRRRLQVSPRTLCVVFDSPLRERVLMIQWDRSKGPGLAGAKNASVSHSYTKTTPFTKTGPGQT